MTGEKKQIIKKTVQFILFCCLVLFIFSRVTYLFRETSCSRDNVTGFEKEGDLDVVCIGASTMVEYFQPLTAWHEYGYTSYDYATLYGQMDLFWRYMDRVLETHNPELFVVDLRMLATLNEEVYEQGLRFWTDSLPIFSKDRYLSLQDYFDRHLLSETDDKISYYLDIAKYHTNTITLGSADNWKYCDNKGKAKNKGYELSSVHHFFEEPVIDTEGKAELTQIQSEVLYQLLDYCREKDLNVLFVVCPYVVPQEDQQVYNTAKDIVTSYGYQFINANEFYDEIGLDFFTDMKNINHVNSVGAEKYTRFLSEYIISHYDIVTHKDEASYYQWDEDYEGFSEELEGEKKKVFQTVADKEDAYTLAEGLSQSVDFAEWSIGAMNTNYTVIVCANLEKCNLKNMNAESKQFLNFWGILDSETGYYLRISSGDEIVALEEQTDVIDYSGSLGVIDGLGQVPCEVMIDDDMKLIIGDYQFNPIQEGIQFVLFDNNYKKVVDSLILIVGLDGSMHMVR